jgi:hypothetical protein
VSSGGAVTGLVLGILMALAIGGVAGSTADLGSTATDTPSDFPTAVDGGIDSTELASWARESWSTGARTATVSTSGIEDDPGAETKPALGDQERSSHLGIPTSGPARALRPFATVR